ncbi:MAG TPA: DUF448 domain-containing protein [Euzebyales bacterium]|nr:DUF448 domain-containing protein [Euzebyales bacterium]
MVDEGVQSSLDRPLRTCVGCRRRHQQRRLIRFAVHGSAVVIDIRQVLPGRGAYLCWRQECAQRVLGDGRRLVRALRAGGDSVTVDTGALLQDWEANRRQARDGTATRRSRKATSAVPPTTVHLASGENT